MLLRYICEELDEQALLKLAASATIVNTDLTRLLRDGPSHSWQVADFNRLDHLTVEQAGVDLRTVHPADANSLPR